MKNITCFPARGMAKTLVKTNTNHSAGSSFTIKKFVRFEVGEGLEKKNEDFAAEVAAQLA